MLCFPDDDKGGFAVVAKTKDVEKMMAANSKAGAKPKPLGGEDLAVQSFFKGVSSGTQIYDKVDKDSDEKWSLEFKSPLHGKMV